jgi:hypothetical protein
MNRRRLLAAGGCFLAPTSSCARSGAARPLGRPGRCADFLDTIGVNTHLGYADSQYNDIAQVAAALRYIGINHVRDRAIDSRSPNSGHYRALAAGGVKFCMFWGVKRSMANAIDQIGALEASYPGAIQALEGPNEIKPAFAYSGLSGIPAARKFMTDMRHAAAANPVLRRKPLINCADGCGL